MIKLIIPFQFQNVNSQLQVENSQFQIGNSQLQVRNSQLQVRNSQLQNETLKKIENNIRNNKKTSIR